MFLLDTDHISFLQRTSSPEFTRVSARMARHDEDDIFFSVVSFQEQVMGWNSVISRSGDNSGVMKGYNGYIEMISQYADMPVLPYDSRAALIFETLRSQRVRIGTLDLRIGAIALSRDFTVVSRNLSDFRRVPGLRVEDWSS